MDQKYLPRVINSWYEWHDRVGAHYPDSISQAFCSLFFLPSNELYSYLFYIYLYESSCLKTDSQFFQESGEEGKGPKIEIAIPAESAGYIR